VATADFTETTGALVATKGGGDDERGHAATLVAPGAIAPPRVWPALTLAFGAEAGVASSTELLPALRLGVESRARHPLSAAVALATRDSIGFRETHARLLIAQRFGLQVGRRVSLLAGVEAGGGVMAQDRDVGAALWTAVANAGVTAGLRVLVAGPVSLTADATAGWSLLRWDTGRLRSMFLPTAWVGLVFAR
jgi:hypothetical protein